MQQLQAQAQVPAPSAPMIEENEEDAVEREAAAVAARRQRRQQEKLEQALAAAVHSHVVKVRVLSTHLGLYLAPI